MPDIFKNLWYIMKNTLPPVGIIGFGHMGEAFACGLQKLMPVSSIFVYEVLVEAKAKALMQYQFQLSKTLAGLIKASTVIILALKPQDLPATLDEIRTILDKLGLKAKNKRFLSLAAGLSLDFYCQKLKTSNIARCAPNLAAKVGRALVAVAIADQALQDFRDQVLFIAQAVGKVMPVSEKLLTSIMAFSGSGIAYIFHFIHALALGAVREGLPYQKALEATLTLIDGAVELLKTSAEHPIALESKVCSPAGMTIEGIRILDDSRFTSTIMDAIRASKNRCEELNE